MREFFKAYCGVPDLLMLSSRQFQHDTFQKEISSLFQAGKQLYVLSAVQSRVARVAPSLTCVVADVVLVVEDVHWWVVRAG